jgi:hypothetical protein
MTARLFSSYLAITTATASSAATGYPATAAMVPGVLRGWRSTAGGTQWLQLDLGSSVSIAAVALQAIMLGSGLAPTIAVTADNSTTPTTARGTMVVGTDRNARAKASLEAASPFTARYVRFTFTGAGSAYGVGSAFAFGSVVPLPCDPLYGGSSIVMLDPQVRADLPNGTTEVYAAGPSLAELELGFRAKGSDDVEVVRRSARALPCWFDFGLSDRGRQWPVRHVEAQTERRLAGYNREAVSIRLREIV